MLQYISDKWWFLVSLDCVYLTQPLPDNENNSQKKTLENLFQKELIDVKAVDLKSSRLAANTK